MIKTKSFELAEYASGDVDSETLALVLPGRLDTKDYPHMKSHVDLLGGLGYYTVSFDPPGTWESPGDISLYTMTNYLKAMEELIEHFGNRKTILIGHSRGGSMAMLGGTRLKNVTKFAAIMSRPSASIPDDEKEYDKNKRYTSFRDNPNGGEQVRFDLPGSYFEDAANYDMTEVLTSCTKPKLFVYGEKDNLTTPENVKKSFEMSADPKQIASVDCEHDYRKFPAVIKQVNILLKEFVEDKK